MLLYISGSFPDNQEGIAAGAKVLLDAMLEHVSREEILLLTTDTPIITRCIAENTPARYELMPNWRVTPANIRRFLRILDTHPITAIHMEYPGDLYGKTFLASFLPAIVKYNNWKRKKSIPFYVRLHEFTHARFLRKIAIVPILLWASGVYVPAQKDRDTVRRFASKRVHPTTIGANIMVEPGARPVSNKVTVSYFGSVYPGKGIERMLSIWKQLRQQDKEDLLRFRIIGDVGTENTNHFADYHKQVWQWIEEYGLADAISVTGYISDAEVSRELMGTDVAILLYEDGLTLRRGSFLAYLAHGIPIITTQGDEEARALFDGHPGICMAQDDLQMIAQVQAWSQLSKAERARIEADNRDLSRYFSWNKIALDFLRDYKML